MVISRCCKKRITQISHYYICNECYIECDTMDISNTIRDYEYESGYDDEVEASSNIS